MLRILGALVVMVFPLVSGCGAGAGPAVEAGSVEVWLERIRETKSVRFDISDRVEGRSSASWTKKGAMSPMRHGGLHLSDAPPPASHLIHRYQSYRDRGTVEVEAIDQDSEVYLRDPSVVMPPGKQWVKIDLDIDMRLYERRKDIVMSLSEVHPGGVFTDFDRKTLVVSAGTRDGDTTRYDLTAGAALETSPNTAKGTRVTGTVWIGQEGLPVKVEQRSTDSGGRLRTRTSVYTDWNKTPAVKVPVGAGVAGPQEVTLPDR